MIHGRIDGQGRGWVTVTVFGLRHEFTLDLLLDTGFEGAICLPIGVAIPLGLELSDVVSVEFADGQILEDELVFIGHVLWHAERITVRVSLTKSETGMIGTELLLDCEVQMNFVTGALTITRVESEGHA